MTRNTSRRALIQAAVVGAAAGPALAQATAPVTAAQAVAEAMKDSGLRPFRAEIEAAMATLDAFMAAFNSRDVKAYDATFNFPSVRFASNSLRLIQAGEQQPSLFETGALKDWDHSAWQKRQVLHAGPDKVHVNTRFARYRKDGSVLGGFDSLYVVNKENGRWGVKIRSSFAP